ncbi:hypothetical protein [Reyranella sp.]|uniref:hypothetical protein n=1 Tax=Reyranella sp. TaxID=1929291 RepID=UPI003D0DDEE9
MILFGALMLLIVSSTLKPSAFRATNMIAQMAALGAVIGFLFVQDQPYLGETAVGPDAIVHAIDAMKARPN